MAIHKRTRYNPTPIQIAMYVHTYVDAQVIHSFITLVVCTHYVCTHTLTHSHPHTPHTQKQHGNIPYTDHLHDDPSTVHYLEDWRSISCRGRDSAREKARDGL